MLAPLTDADPRAVGRYRLQGRLGVGGMGAVYLGFDSAGRPFAVKVIRPDLAGDPEFRERFRREVAAACRVRSDFVAQVRDADVDAASPWMATEYVEGVSLLAAVARRDRLGGPMLTDLACGLADGLVAIHAAGLVHRDLKPANILLAWDGPKIIDFGIARALDATSHTGTGTVLGTVAWMAPEQLRGERTSPAADIFAWAMCVVFAASGRHAFPAETHTASAVRILRDAPDLTGVPEALVPLLTQALDKEPARRPSAVDVVSSLAIAQAGTQTGIRVGDPAGAGVGGATRRLIERGWVAPTPPPIPPAPPLPTSPDLADKVGQANQMHQMHQVVPPTRLHSARRNRVRRTGAVLFSPVSAAVVAIVVAVAALATVLARTGGDSDAALNPDPAGQHTALEGNPGGATPSETAATPSPTAATPSMTASATTPTAQPTTAPPPPATAPLYRYYSGADHASLTRTAPSGYNLEFSIGAIYATGEVPGTHPLFECWMAGNSFTSAAANCEGQQVVGYLGWVYSAPQSNPATVPIVRCVLGGAEHFDSNDPACEGQQVQGVLGYALAG